MYGSDQSASISVETLKNFAQSVRVVEKIMGNGKKEILDSEIPIRKKLRIDKK